jgi:hypothetical protein
MAAHAANLLFARADALPEGGVLPHRMAVRESTAPPKR